MQQPDPSDSAPPVGVGFSTDPDSSITPAADEHSSVKIEVTQNFVPENAPAVLIKHLFAQPDSQINGISYAISYKLAEQHAGGDIVDLYHFNNNSVAFSIADISGKGTQAAVHAAMIKYGLRAYASHGLTPEKVLRALDRLYLENNTFEKNESFATVFFGLVDPSRRLLSYACAAHEPVFLIHIDGTVEQLKITAPLIGVFDDQSHLFKEAFVELRPGTLLIAVTDGVSEARNPEGELFGMQRLIDIALTNRHEPEQRIVDKIISNAEQFCGSQGCRDDIAVLAARFG